MLIVDDEPALRDSTRAHLQRAFPAARILVATSPHEAIQLVETSGFDLVISDHHMPGGEGRALLARIREISPGTVRVLFTAGSDPDADAERVASGEFHAVVPKTLGGPTIVETIARLLGTQRPGDERKAGPLAPPTPAAVDGRHPETGGKRLLVVDDEVQIGRLIEAIAERLPEGVEVVVETDPRVAATLIESSKFDVIISDYRMPGMSGMKLLAHARACQPRAKRILITGYNEILEPPDILAEADVDAYVHKPLAVGNMLLLIGRILRDEKDALTTYREQAKIIERAAAREQRPIGLDDL
jgi:CheY-like chemotaxis protein